MSYRQIFFDSLPKTFLVEPFVLSRHRIITFLRVLGHEFLRKKFRLTMPQLFVVELFCVSENF